MCAGRGRLGVGGLEDGAIRRRAGVRDRLVDHLDVRLLVRREPEHAHMRPVVLVDGLDGVGVPARGDEAEVAEVLDALGQRSNRRGPAGVEVVGLRVEPGVVEREHRHVAEVVRGEAEELLEDLQLRGLERVGGAHPAHRHALDLGVVGVLVGAERALGDPGHTVDVLDQGRVGPQVDRHQARVGDDADVGLGLDDLGHPLEVSGPADDVRRKDLAPLLDREQVRGLLGPLDEHVPVGLHRLEVTLGQNRDFRHRCPPVSFLETCCSPHLAALHRYATEL